MAKQAKAETTEKKVEVIEKAVTKTDKVKATAKAEFTKAYDGLTIVRH